MLPFDSYPGGGRRLLGRPRLGNGTSRSGYGLDLRTKTQQCACAYCSVDLFADYHRWLLLQVDHVVPIGEARRLEIPREFYEDAINLVLACSGCNGFDNRYSHRPGIPKEWSLDEFVTLRDTIFAERAARITSRHASEMALFARAPWADEPAPKSQPGPTTTPDPLDTPAVTPVPIADRTS